MRRQLKINVNGAVNDVHADPDRPLLDVIREDLHLTGTKYGCGEGECGACTVLIDGVPTRSCITTVGEAADSSIETIESVADETELHPVQQAFLDHHAMQCGYCVPGHIMTAVALSRDGKKLTTDDVVEAMSGHICRCCNYVNIRAAVDAAVGGQDDE